MPSFLDADTRVTGGEAAAGSTPTEAPSSGLRSFDILANYQLLKRLGGGGMAEVYLARSALGEGVEKLVAFKTALPTFGPDTPLGAMFLTEARVSATLQHPNVVQVFDFGEAAGRPYLAMEFVHGRDLGAVLQASIEAGKRLPVGFAVAVAIDVCKALEYAHEKKDLKGVPLKLVHRDVSPQNVLVSSRGEVKLMDFGVAAAEGASQNNAVVGKQIYAAPEAGPKSTPAPSWDVYALGVTLRQLLTQEDLIDDLNRPPSALNPDVPMGLDAVVMTATGGPTMRFPTARAFREALEALSISLEDVGATVRELFGEAIAAEEKEIEALVAQGQARAPRRTTVPELKTLRTLRRKVAASRASMWLAQRPMVRWAAIGAGALVVGAIGWGVISVTRANAAFAREVSLADARVSTGELVGPGGDAALDHLLAAQKMRPNDPAVHARLAALADAFMNLGEKALARKDHAEAAVHFQAALQADPNRDVARLKLAEIEKAVREAERGKVRRY